jgi:hypothetical protein
MPTFADLGFAYPGPEGAGGSLTPRAGQGGQTTITRKRAVDNATFQMPATDVCQLPNNSLTDGLRAGANSCIIIAEASDGSIPAGTVLIRMWMDGTAPTTITGIPLYAGMPVEIIGQDDLLNTRFVSADGNPHVLQVQYFTGL